MASIPDVAIGAIVAALIAGLISLLGLVISKEQKTSEFRQAWIDALRTELSLVIAHANGIHGAILANKSDSANTPRNATDLWKIVREDFIRINEATAKIRLRLNPMETQAKAVLDTIEGLERLLAPEHLAGHSTINDLEKRLVSEAQVLLKSEWVRVQKGEATYRAARFAALAVSVACVCALMVAIAAKLVGLE